MVFIPYICFRYPLAGKATNQGRAILLQLNEEWKSPDEDYTPFNNILSAVWSKLRHDSYKWAVIQDLNLDSATYYRMETELHLVDPASHPNAIESGTTGLLPIVDRM